MTADRDQEIADRSLSDSGSGYEQADHDRSRAERESTKEDREAATLARSISSSDRDRQAATRDETANERDRDAERRDRRDEAGDAAAAISIKQAGSGSMRVHAAIEAAMTTRKSAALSRRRAAEDRERAATDRAHAAADRVRAAVDLERAHLDDLTGAYRRGMGMSALAQEVDRARRDGGHLVLAYVDIDGLKRVNDDAGHAAGDDVLRTVSEAIRERLRTYDPMVRMGGDEFVCTISDASEDGARTRFDEINDLLGSRATISVGVVTLREGESLDELIKRGDDAMYARKAPPA